MKSPEYVLLYTDVLNASPPWAYFPLESKFQKSDVLNLRGITKCRWLKFKEINIYDSFEKFSGGEASN